MSALRSFPARNRAKTLLRHYLVLIGDAAGLRMDSDTMIEIDEIVDSIIEAAVAEIKGAPNE